LHFKTHKHITTLKIKHLLFAILMSVAGILSTQAQTRITSVTLKGIVTDSITNQPMAFATVTLLKVKDSSAVTGGLTTAKGDFNIPGVRPGAYTLKIAYMGYKSILNPLTIKATTKEVTIGPFTMNSNTKTLGEVIIEGQKAPVVVKTDTVEFTAVNFKVEKNDVVEEMIKKLPGVEVDKDGNITAHGKSVTKVLVDGKPFFGNDPKLATQNLPAEMIDKIQVIDQKSDQAQFTKIDDGQTEKVINIISKMGYKRGNFGKMSLGDGQNVGTGADNRYDLSGMFNSFKDDRQLSVIAMSNNTNVTRFTADMGASMGRGGGGGGGRGASGINVTNAVGVNFKNKVGKLDWASSYFYNQRSSDNSSNSHRQTSVSADSSFLTNTNNINKGDNINHRFNMQMDYTADTSFSMRFVPNISFGNSSSSSVNDVYSTGSKVPSDSINHSKSITSNSGTNMNASGFLLLRKRFAKPRRTLSMNLSGSYSLNDGNGYNSSQTSYFSTVNTVNKLDSLIDIKQNNVTKSNGSGFGARLVYTEPLSRFVSLQLESSYNYRYSNSDKKTYDFSTATNDYSLLNKRYTNHFENTYQTQHYGISVQKQKEMYDWTFGVGVDPVSISSKMLIKDTMRYPTLNVVNFAPMADFDYKFDKNTRLKFQYQGRANQPDISQLQPIEDNSNPLLITKGNPNLKPEFSNNLDINFNTMNYVNFANYYVSSSISNTMNRITNLNTYGNGGVQTTIPVNVNGGFNSQIMVGLGKPFKQNKFVLNTFGRFSYNESMSYSSNRNTPVGTGSDILANLPPKNTTTNVSGTYNLGFTLNLKNFTVNTSGRATYTKAKYTISTSQNTEYTNYAVSTDARLTLFSSLRLASDISYSTNNGMSTGYSQTTTMWNANITKDFFKDKRAQIRIQLYDILGQAVSIRHTTTENYTEDSQSKVLTRYFLVSFIYNFNKFLGAQKAQQQGDRGPGMRMGGDGYRGGGGYGGGGGGGQRGGGGGGGF